LDELFAGVPDFLISQGWSAEPVRPWFCSINPLQTMLTHNVFTSSKNYGTNILAFAFLQENQSLLSEKNTQGRRVSGTHQRQPVSGTRSEDAETSTTAGTSARLRPAFDNQIRQSLRELRIGPRAVIAESRSLFFNKTDQTSTSANAQI